jgi:DNA-binding transcriptional MerR regulator
LKEVSKNTWEFDMTDRPYLRTHDLALAGGISVQQVRNYEASGLIPKAQRSPSGYRLYT